MQHPITLLFVVNISFPLFLHTILNFLLIPFRIRIVLLSQRYWL